MSAFIAAPLGPGCRPASNSRVGVTSFAPRVSTVTLRPRFSSKFPSRSPLTASAASPAAPQPNHSHYISPIEPAPAFSDESNTTIVDPPIPPTNLREIVTGLRDLLKPIGESKWKRTAILWGIATVLLAAAVTAYAVVLANVKKFFWNCLASKDVSQFPLLLTVYFVAVCVGPFIEASFNWVKSRLALLWRRVLTERLLGRYLTNLNYYKLSVGMSDDQLLDNPDQRISETIIAFTERAVNFTTAIGVAVFDLIVFSVILYAIYPPLWYTLLAYAAIGSFVIMNGGRGLMKLLRMQNRKEGDFRFNMVRLRENTESVAFYAGERSEESELRRRFFIVIDNSKRLLGTRRNVEFMSTAFRYVAQVLPTAVIAPRYFSGAVPLGVISQVYSAFNKVLSSTGLFVQEFQGLTQLGAGVRRLKDLLEALDRLDGESARQHAAALTAGPAGPGHIVCDTRDDAGQFLLKNVSVRTPAGASATAKLLVANVNISVSFGERLLITGDSGAGKTSLLRAICGLWTFGSGHVIRPSPSSCIFLPQRPFIMLGTLRDNVAYPGRRPVPDDALCEALRAVNLAYLLDRPGGLDMEGERLASKLSLGEQQRLAFARVVVAKPDFVILDESTSALDLENEALMYHVIKDLGIACISVSNRPSLLDVHQRVLRIEGEGKWSLLAPSEARAKQQWQSVS